MDRAESKPSVSVRKALINDPETFCNNFPPSIIPLRSEKRGLREACASRLLVKRPLKSSGRVIRVLPNDPIEDAKTLSYSQGQA
jgi:hypothetical protein